MKDEYIRSAKVKRVLSGDTVVLKVDLGFRIEATLACRLFGIATPAQGEFGFRPARLELVDYLSDCANVVVQSISTEPCTGTFTGILFATKDGARTDVSHWMLENGFAIEWDGRGEKPPVPWPPLGPNSSTSASESSSAQDNAEESLLARNHQVNGVTGRDASLGGERLEPIIPTRDVLDKRSQTETRREYIDGRRNKQRY